LKRIELPSWQQKILDEVQPSCESIREVEAGILITPKSDLSALQLAFLHQRLREAGAEYNYSGISSPYLIPKENFIRQHLQKLRIIFQTSQSEISESMMFLVREGVSVERIQSETGASRATVYRYIRQVAQPMETEQQPKGS